jgi:hypothetical protein
MKFRFGITLAIAPLMVAFNSATTIAQLPPVQDLANPAGTEPSSGISQVTSVSQLSDVQPTDWAFQALQSLVERYGCIAGYPNRTYRGNRAMTRYEFAAGLNACMDRVNELIASATADLVKKEDLEALKKLQEQFAAELATLRGRVDTLEAKTKTLEAQQFSTTTKLEGEVVFGVIAADNDNQTTFQNRVELGLKTSFTGKDELETVLASGNAPLLSFNNTINPNGSAEGRLSFQESTGNAVELDSLSYRFPVGKKLNVFVAAVGAEHSDYLSTTANPYLNEGNQGSISFLGQFNPIYYIGGGSGLGLNYDISENVSVNLGYLAGGADDPASPLAGNGLFNGSYAALAQISFQPWKGKLQVAATYVNSYHTPGTALFGKGGDQPGFAGTDFANNPSLGSTGISANSGGVTVSYAFTPKFVATVWGSYTKADLKSVNAEADVWSYALALAFPDLGRKGNLGGIIAGASPYLGNAPELLAVENSVPVHLEGFYKVKVNDYISVTPGVIYLMNPNQTSNGDDAIIGTVRTTFSF